MWAHAAEAHGIEEDKRRCLWAGCGRHFAKPFEYRAHEGVHTGAVSDRNGCGLAPAEFCCRHFAKPFEYRAHEGVHTGAVSDRNGCGLAPAEFCCRRAFAPLSTGDWRLASTVETGNWLIKIDAME